jgi:hypothetical protein
MEKFEGLPLYKTKLSADKKIQSFFCTMCNQTHIHGVGKFDDTGRPSHRVAHCTDDKAIREHKNGYYIYFDSKQITSDAIESSFLELHWHIVHGNKIKTMLDDISHIKTEATVHKRKWRYHKRSTELTRVINSCQKALSALNSIRSSLENNLALDIHGIFKDPHFTHIYYGEIGSYQKMNARSQETPPNPLAESP